MQYWIPLPSPPQLLLKWGSLSQAPRPSERSKIRKKAHTLAVLKLGIVLKKTEGLSYTIHIQLFSQVDTRFLQGHLGLIPAYGGEIHQLGRSMTHVWDIIVTITIHPGGALVAYASGDNSEHSSPLI